MKKKLFAAIVCIFSSVALAFPLAGCGDSGYEWAFDETCHWRVSTNGRVIDDIKLGKHKNNDKMCTVCGRYLPPEKSELLENDVFYQWNEEFNGYCVKGVEEDQDVLTQLSIPEEVNGYPVTYIGEGALYKYIALTSVEIPDSIKYIGNHAFFGCSALKSIEIPDSVKKIGEYVFAYCESLTSIEIPDSVTEIGEGTFWNCESLEKIVLPDTIKIIDLGTFDHCISLTDIVIPDSVTSIRFDAFRYCTALKSIVIPDSVTVVEVAAFEYCKSLTIYCEAEEKPSGWDNDWNICSKHDTVGFPVVWGYKG